MGWRTAKCLMILGVFLLSSCGEDQLPSSAAPIADEVEAPKIKNRAEQKIEDEGLGLIETLSGPDGKPTFYVVRGPGVGNKYALDEHGNEVSIPFAEDKVNEAWEAVTGKLTRYSYQLFEKSSPDTKLSVYVRLLQADESYVPDFEDYLQSVSEIYQRKEGSVNAIVKKQYLNEKVLRSKDVDRIRISLYGGVRYRDQ